MKAVQIDSTVTSPPLANGQSLVAERAVVQRVNRSLAKRGQKLIKSKGPRQVVELGTWHIADERQGEPNSDGGDECNIMRHERASLS